MKVLVACEESQAVTIELRRLGHEAYSCDIEPCSGGYPGWHLQCDVLPLLNGNCKITTCAGDARHILGAWDMIIAFPPCTYLTSAGAVRLFSNDGRVKDTERYAKGQKAAEFFQSCLSADCLKIAVENPRQLRCFGLPAASQFVEPFMFGEPWRKKTGLWLKGIPNLKPTNIVEPKGLWVGSTSAKRDPSIYTRYELHGNRDAKRRAKTFPGIARAMAEQWAGDATRGNQ